MGQLPPYNDTSAHVTSLPNNETHTVIPRLRRNIQGTHRTTASPPRNEQHDRRDTARGNAVRRAYRRPKSQSSGNIERSNRDNKVFMSYPNGLPLYHADATKRFRRVHTARLRTHHAEGAHTDQLVSISADHDYSKGPHQDTVGFAVGSNQEILPTSEKRPGFLGDYERWQLLGHAE